MRSMKVVFVFPPYNVSASWGSGRRMREGVLPPLGVGYLAASIEAEGHRAMLVDAAAEALSIAETAEAVLAHQPDLVGITSLTHHAIAAYDVAASLKSRMPALPIVMGGPHVTAFWQDILKDCSAIDWLVPGEAERSFAGLVNALADGREYASLPGLVYRDAAGNAVATPPLPPLRILDQVLPPARHIYNQRSYRPLPNQGRRSPAAIVLSSRGCPYGKCTFCFQGGRYASPYRRRTPENVIDEIRELVHGQGFREIMFWDENFCVDTQWIVKFCDLLDREAPGIPWTVQGCVSTVTEPMLQRMAMSGCYNIFFGFESGCQELLDLVHKGITLDMARAAMAHARAAGLEVRGSFILGFPTETLSMSEETVRFACELSPDYANFVPFHPWPGTPIEAFALSKGRYLGWKNEFLAPSYVPNTYADADALVRMLQHAYRRFYLRPRYISRMLWRSRTPTMLRRTMLGVRFWISMRK